MADTDDAELSRKTEPTPAEAAFVARLAQAVWPVTRTQPELIGEGSNNRVYRVEDGKRAFAVKVAKPHRAGLAADEHRKELWCAAAARRAGVPTPAIMFAGDFDRRPYLIQEFVAGREPDAGQRTRAWSALGEWARRIHRIPISGWGNRLAADGVFDGDWRAHLAYNVGALTADDPLIALGVLDARTSADLKRRFERLAVADFAIGLCHGDLAPHNMLAGGDGAMSLIDWGCAFAAPVPHYELNEIIRSGKASGEDLQRFTDAYGLSETALAEVRADLPDLLALREVDTLRWALGHRPAETDDYVRSAKRALSGLS